MKSGKNPEGSAQKPAANGSPRGSFRVFVRYTRQVPCRACTSRHLPGNGQRAAHTASWRGAEKLFIAFYNKILYNKMRQVKKKVINFGFV